MELDKEKGKKEAARGWSIRKFRWRWGRGAPANCQVNCCCVRLWNHISVVLWKRQNKQYLVHRHTFIHWHALLLLQCFINSWFMWIHVYSDCATSLAEVKTREDGQEEGGFFWREVFDSPAVTCLLHPSNAATAMTVHSRSTNSSLLKCWILFGLIDSVKTITKYIHCIV